MAKLRFYRENEKTKINLEEADYVHVFSYDEAKQNFIDTCEGKGLVVSSSDYLKYRSRDLLQDVTDFKYKKTSKGQGWDGGTSYDMYQWIINGYKEKLTTYEGELFSKNDKRSFFFDEEGEIMIDMALSGSDYPFLNQHPKKRKPGIKITFIADFNANVENNYIKAYSAFIGKLVHTMEYNGYDVECVASYPNNSLYGGYNESVDTRVILTEPNQLTNISDWDALLSPAGYRKMIFRLWERTAVMNQKQCDAYLGEALMSDQNIVQFDEQTRELTIIPYHPRGYSKNQKFNEKEMLNMVQELNIL